MYVRFVHTKWMDFEWDEAKNEANIEKHSVCFETAARIFDGPVLERIDDRVDYGEIRNVVIGLAQGIELFVVYTMRDDVCHIISARKANRRERQAYYQIFPRGTS